MNLLGNGLSAADHDADALSVREAELSMLQQIGASRYTILGLQSNLANTYQQLGRIDEALCLQRELYSGCLKLHGEEHVNTLRESLCYASGLIASIRLGEAKSLMRKTIPVAQRVLGESHEHTLKMRWVYADTICRDNGYQLDDLREAVEILEDSERIARRVLGGMHPTTVGIERHLQAAREALDARETGAS